MAKSRRLLVDVFRSRCLVCISSYRTVAARLGRTRRLDSHHSDGATFWPTTSAGHLSWRVRSLVDNDSLGHPSAPAGCSRMVFSRRLFSRLRLGICRLGQGNGAPYWSTHGSRGSAVLGVNGVAALKKGSCYCITQSKKSCVVYGMPHAVESRALSDESLPLDQIANRIQTIIG